MRLFKFTARFPGTNSKYNIYVNPDKVQCVREVIATTSIQLVSGIEYQVEENIRDVIADLNS